MLHDNMIQFSIFVVYFMMLSVIASNDKVIGQWIDKNFEETGCSPFVLLHHMHGRAEKTMKNVKIARFIAEIRNDCVLSISVECYHYTSLHTYKI
jgi:hypothetical protein